MGLVLQRRAVPITEQGADITAKGRPYYNGGPKYYSEEPAYYSEGLRITAKGRAYYSGPSMMMLLMMQAMAAQISTAEAGAAATPEDGANRS